MTLDVARGYLALATSYHKTMNTLRTRQTMEFWQRLVARKEALAAAQR